MTAEEIHEIVAKRLGDITDTSETGGEITDNTGTAEQEIHNKTFEDCLKTTTDTCDFTNFERKQ